MSLLFGQESRRRAAFVVSSTTAVATRRTSRYLPQQHQVLTTATALRCFTSSSWGNNDDNNHDNSDAPSSADQHALFEQQMEEMKAEREALFGFTQEDKDGWTNAAGHQHDASFMDLVNQAREKEAAAAEELALDDDDDPVLYKTDETSSSAGADAASTPLVSLEDMTTKKAVSTSTLTHLTSDGKDVRMVNIGTKEVTERVAVAETKVIFPPEVLESLTTQSDEMVGPKGPIFATAKIAGIMAAKRTSDLIPLCHPLPLNSVNISIRLQEDGSAWIRCECRVTHKTGVEMEALTGATVAALTIYDMTKAISHDIRIEGTRLISKRGGKREVG